MALLLHSFYMLLLICFGMFAMVSGSTSVCTNPSVSTDTYTSKSKALSTLTAYVTEFTLSCKEEETNQKLNLYAEIEQGILLPVAVAGPESNNYQLSWTQDHAKAVQGTIPVKIFSDEGFAAYRKAQRSGGDLSEVKPLFTVTIDHPGAVGEGVLVNTEFVAALCCLLVVWSANSMRSRIMA